MKDVFGCACIHVHVVIYYLHYNYLYCVYNKYTVYISYFIFVVKLFNNFNLLHRSLSLLSNPMWRNRFCYCNFCVSYFTCILWINNRTRLFIPIFYISSAYICIITLFSLWLVLINYNVHKVIYFIYFFKFNVCVTCLLLI